VDLALLTALNHHRANREAVALLTGLDTGQARLVTLETMAEDPLAEALGEAFRTGKSTRIDSAGEPVFINVHVPPVKLIIIGAVHISQALADMARQVELDCTIIDPRTAFATPERFPHVPLIAEWPDIALPPLKPDRFTAFVALTHDPKIDDPALTIAIRAGCFYIGALGSRKTHAKRLERLAALGFDEAELARIHAPIGLDIGAVSPAEIAVSILGEIIANQRQKRRR
jgi:xanthine dehydrogenase accessory factor